MNNFNFLENPKEKEAFIKGADEIILKLIQYAFEKGFVSNNSGTIEEIQELYYTMGLIWKRAEDDTESLLHIEQKDHYLKLSFIIPSMMIKSFWIEQYFYEKMCECYSAIFRIKDFNELQFIKNNNFGIKIELLSIGGSPIFFSTLFTPDDIEKIYTLKYQYRIYYNDW